MMAKKNSIITDTLTDLDQPFEDTGFMDIFRKGKLKCTIIYEDGSSKDFYIKFKDAYFVTIRKRVYFVYPENIIRAKKPWIAWYFNNPFPISFKYIPSKLTAKDMIPENRFKLLSNDEQDMYADITMDSDCLNSVFNAKLMKGLYASTSMTTKQLIYIMVVVVIIILIVLQATGTVDVLGSLGIGAGGT